MTYTPIAHHTETRIDHTTGEDCAYVDEYAVERIQGSEITAKVYADCGPYWTSTYRQTDHVILCRRRKVYDSYERMTSDWTATLPVKGQDAAFARIAEFHMQHPKDAPHYTTVRATGANEFALYLETFAAKQKRAYEIHLADVERKRVAVERKAHLDASEAAFRRMRDGTPQGKELAHGYCDWIRSIEDDATEVKRIRDHEVIRPLYDAVIAATTVPAKKKAIKALLAAV
jgi:hypothetical protein